MYGWVIAILLGFLLLLGGLLVKLHLEKIIRESQHVLEEVLERHKWLAGGELGHEMLALVRIQPQLVVDAHLGKLLGAQNSLLVLVIFLENVAQLSPVLHHDGLHLLTEHGAHLIERHRGRSQFLGLWSLGGLVFRP